MRDRERRRAPRPLWAIRGGGGNFGVVTSFKFRLHDVDGVFAGPTFWAIDESADVLSAYREFPQCPARAERVLCLRRRAAGAPVSRGAAPAQGLRSRLVLRRPGPSRTRPRRWRRCSTTFPSPCCTACRRCRTRLCRARSTRSIRRVTSGIGVPTSSTRSLTKRSTPPGSALRCRLGSRPCTCPIDGAVHDVDSSDTAWATATRAGAQSSRALIQTRRTLTRSSAGPSTTTRPCTRSRLAAPTST